jgi:hypothetical protein
LALALGKELVNLGASCGAANDSKLIEVALFYAGSKIKQAKGRYKISLYLLLTPLRKLSGI